MADTFNKLLLDIALSDLGHVDGPVEVVAHAPVLWSGWEGDHDAVLVRMADGTEHAVLLSGTVAEGRDAIAKVLAERLIAYEEAIARTRAFLDRLAPAP